MAHKVVNGFCTSGCKVPVKPAAQVEDVQHGGTGISAGSLDELKTALGIGKVEVDSEVTQNGVNPVSGAAVAAYVAEQISLIADYDGEAF